MGELLLKKKAGIEKIAKLQKIFFKDKTEAKLSVQ
jgi:hypothetical protein